MLAWLVSIDIVEMNHRHKPKKESNSKRFKTKYMKKTLKLTFGKMSNFLKGKLMIFGKVLLWNYGLHFFLKIPKKGFYWFLWIAVFFDVKNHKECVNSISWIFGKAFLWTKP